MSEESGIVADGFERARKSNERKIQTEIEQEYVEKLADASTYKERKELKSEMKREFDRRIAKLVPPDALY